VVQRHWDINADHLDERHRRDAKRWCFEQGQPVEEIADFLCRDVQEIEAGLLELGLRSGGAAH
jgi:hypothetical protein